ncbi:MAG: DUF2851 family protein [Cytophagales bacterium]
MKEKVLQHLWMAQPFGSEAIYTTGGRRVKILCPGRFNEHTGPDFLDAHVVVDDVDLHGHVEIHQKSSDWYTHQHHQNLRYRQVILHVVWIHNKPVEIQGNHLFTIELSTFLKRPLVDLFHTFESFKPPVLCAAYFSSVSSSYQQKMLKKALEKRFQAKSDWVKKLLENNKEHSDATLYQVLAYAFGFKLNSDAFLALSERAPFTIIKKCTQNLRSIEALLFGSAGFLQEIPPRQAYLKDLKDRYTYFKQQYNLPPPLEKERWHFFRTRPRNFPTIRIAQFARLLYRQENLLDFLLNVNYESFVKRMRKLPSLYWRTHYLIGKRHPHKGGRMGHVSINSIVINAVVPILITYGNLRNEDFYLKRAIDLLKILPPEANHITRMWRKIGLEISSAFDSQASLALLKYFCSPQKCLQCHVGQQILRKHPTPPPCFRPPA